MPKLLNSVNNGDLFKHTHEKQNIKKKCVLRTSNKAKFHHVFELHKILSIN
jgi:hypothetical protein